MPEETEKTENLTEFTKNLEQYGLETDKETVKEMMEEAGADSLDEALEDEDFAYYLYKGSTPVTDKIRSPFKKRRGELILDAYKTEDKDELEDIQTDIEKELDKTTTFGEGKERLQKTLGKVLEKLALPDQIEQEAVEKLKSETPAKRRKGIQELTEKYGKKAIPYLKIAMIDEDPYVRRKAVEQLGQIKHKDVIEPLSRLLDDEDEFVRWKAKGVLNEIRQEKGEKVIPPLMEAFKTANSEQKSKIKKILQNIEEDRNSA